MTSPGTHPLAVLCVGLVLALPAVAGAQPLIVIDAGHGGSDPGAVGCSLEEANVVLDVAQRLRVLLEGSGVRVALTRDDDTFVGLSARAAYANSRAADGFFSVHSNANAGTPATGTETFVMTGAGARSRALGGGIQAAMIAAWGLRDRGLKEANFAVLRETTMPAALGELAFTNRCDPDAALLADPTARQRLAERVHGAVLTWLGIDPATPTTGTLRGVVFEDQGVGTEDLTVRLPGASVRVTPGDATATADATEGAWSFALMPGDYTVEASHAGHVTTSRVCTVTSGMTTWCSVGLLPDAVMETDAGEAATTDAAAVMETDAGTSTTDTDAGDGRAPVEGCGCTVVGGAARGGWASLGLLAAALLVLSRRRRGAARAAAIAVAAALAIGCAHDAPPSGAAPLTRSEGVTEGDAPAPVGRATTATPVAALATLGAPREWLAEGYVTPIVAPDGAHVLLSTEDHAALFVADLEGDGFREICRVGRCGWEPRWQDDGAAVAYRTAGQSGTAVPAEARTLAGERVPVRVGERGVHAWTDDDDRAWLRDGARTRAIGPEGERVMMPAITGDGRHVVMWSLSEGVLVHRVADGVLVRVGAGGHPRIDPSGRWMVFERTEDDGHEITRSDLFVVDLADPSYAVAPLVVSDDHLERMPSLSRIDEAGAGTLAYLADGALVVRTIRLSR